MTASRARMRSRRRCGCLDRMETCKSLSSHSKSNFSISITQTDRFDNMRYFWGFVQLQDMLDNAIIEMKTDSVSLGIALLIVKLVFDCEMADSLVKAHFWSLIVQVVQDGVFLQQFPYPCFQRNNFLSGLYTIQLLQVLMFGPTILAPTSWYCSSSSSSS